MTQLLYPPERKPTGTADPFDPVIEGARHRLPQELALAIWERACADAIDGAGVRDPALARRRFHDLAARIAARGGRLRPEVGKLTRVGETMGDGAARGLLDELTPRQPGRDTLVLAAARRRDGGGEAEGDTGIAQVAAATAGADAAEKPLAAPPVLTRAPAEPAAMPRSREPSARSEHAAHRPLRFDDYCELAIKELLRRAGSNSRSRQAVLASAADPIHSIAGVGAHRRQPRLQTAPANGNSLWQVAVRHAATLYRRAMDRGAIDAEDPAIEAVLRQRAVGQSLPVTLRREMEEDLGVSLVGVRIHTDAVAAQAARALDAEAFTLGEDIFFAEGAFDAGTRSGRKLLAHELAHVAQTLRGQTPPAGGELRVSHQDDPLEREADAMAERIDAAPARPDHAPDGMPEARGPVADHDRPLDGEVGAVRSTPARATAVESRDRSPATSGAIQRKDGDGQSLVPKMTVTTQGTTARVAVLGQLVATAYLPEDQGSLNVQDLWDSSTGKYALSIECGFGGKIALNQAGIDALTRMVPHIRGAITVREKGAETPYDVLKFASFGRGVVKPSPSSLAAAATPEGGDHAPKVPPEGRPGAQSTPQSKPPDGGAASQTTKKPNPYAAMTSAERAQAVSKLLGQWWTGGDILQAFQACNPRDFIVLQEKVDLAAVLDKLDTWQIVKLGALGPILASQRQRVNEARADLIQDITHSWGAERAQIFTHYMFNTMPDDDAVSVLRLLAAGQHLHETIDLMPEVGKLLEQRGIDRSKIRDRGWEAMDILRGIGRGLGGMMSTSEAARSGESIRAMSMTLDLPSPYQDAVNAVDQAAFMRALSPGNIAFGTLDYATMGLLSAAKGVVYDIPKGMVSGVGQIAEGHVASGVEQLTGPAIFIVGVILGVRGFRKSARMAAMLELTEEGKALYGPLKARLGAQGMDKVAKWVQGSSEAQILVRQEGAAGIEALYRAQGDVVAARAELATSRAASTSAAATAGESTAAGAGESAATGAGAGESAAAGRTVDASSKVAKTSTGYRLNRKNIQNYEKIAGQPESVIEADANREALAAEQAASKSSVERVYLGTEADQLINGNQGRAMSADVVAVNKQGQYYVYEAKGMNIEHGLEQLEHTAQQLGPSRVVRQTLVVPERINTPGYTVQNGILYLGDKPALIAGKPVNVVFTTQK